MFKKGLKGLVDGAADATKGITPDVVKDAVSKTIDVGKDILDNPIAKKYVDSAANTTEIFKDLGKTLASGEKPTKEQLEQAVMAGIEVNDLLSVTGLTLDAYKLITKKSDDEK